MTPVTEHGSVDDVVEQIPVFRWFVSSQMIALGPLGMLATFCPETSRILNVGP